MDKTNLLENVVKLNIKSRPKSKEGKKKKYLQKYMLFINIEKQLIMLLEVEYF